MKEIIKHYINKINKSSVFKPIICILVLLAISMIPAVINNDKRDDNSNYSESTENSNYPVDNDGSKEEEVNGSAYMRFLKNVHIGTAHIVSFSALTIALGILEYRRDHLGNVKKKDK